MAPTMHRTLAIAKNEYWLLLIFVALVGKYSKRLIIAGEVGVTEIARETVGWEP